MAEIGIDCVEIERIAEAIKNPKFIERIYTPAEIQYCESKAKPAQHFAGRFAAKEAARKALAPLGAMPAFSDIEVTNLSDGRPIIQVSGKYAPKGEIKVSITHSLSLAIATVLISD